MQDNASRNITSNKFALIYEFNSKSPLFARVADDLYEKENYDKALEILENGIQLFPDYPTAYFIYAKVLAATGNIEKAKEMVKNGSKIIGSEETEDFYLNKIFDISSVKSSFNDSKRVSFLEDAEPDTKNNEFSDSESEAEEKLEDRLDFLAEELNGAKIEIPNGSEDEQDQFKADSSSEDSTEDDNFYGKQFISETLAGIYFAQKNYKAAKNIYEKLIEVEPEKKALFENKIEEIDKLLQNKKE